MFKISPINDANIQTECASACDSSVKDGFFAYAMTDLDTNELMAFSQFEIDGEYGYISDIKPRVGLSDFEAMFILGRATMNFIDLCGAHKCTACPDAADERLLKAIGFKQSHTGEWIVDMIGMFDGHCDGSAIDLNK